MIQSLLRTGDLPPFGLSLSVKTLFMKFHLTFFLFYLPVFIVCHVKTDSLVSAAPDLRLKLIQANPGLILGCGGDGRGGWGREEKLL